MDIRDDIVRLREYSVYFGEVSKDSVKDSFFHERFYSILNSIFNESIIHLMIMFHVRKMPELSAIQLKKLLLCYIYNILYKHYILAEILQDVKR